MSKIVKSDIAREYIIRFPSTPSLTLAKKIYAENIAVFKDVEDARSFVRFVRGISGKLSRKTKDKQLKLFHIKPRSLNKNPFHLPKSAECGEPDLRRGCGAALLRGFAQGRADRRFPGGGEPSGIASQPRCGQSSDRG